jgi:hypothetical protein
MLVKYIVYVVVFIGWLLSLALFPTRPTLGVQNPMMVYAGASLILFALWRIRRGAVYLFYGLLPLRRTDDPFSFWFYISCLLLSGCIVLAMGAFRGH